MSDSIFIDELPVVESSEVEKLKEKYPQYDPYFIVCSSLKKYREKFDKLWKNYKPYADTHFKDQIKINFHQRSWEMYVGNILLKDATIISSKDEGPDFIIDESIYIECVAPTKGDSIKSDSVPEMYVAKTPQEIRVMNVPTDQMILRITQAIKSKALDQYEKWKSKSWFNNKMSFIIALNTADLQHVEDSNMPNIIKALFGFQFMSINIKTGETNYTHRNSINKTNNEPVLVDYFTNNEFSFVSGVLFSDNLVSSHPDDIGDDCYFVNNPFADNPINDSFKKHYKRWTATKFEGKLSLKKEF